MFLNKLSKKEKVGLGIAVAFALLASFDRVIVEPINDRIQQINREINISEKQLGRDLRNLNQKEVITEEYQKYIQYVKKVGSDEEEVAKILVDIEELARKSRVYLVNIKPQSSKEIDFYKEYTIEINIEGEMEPIMNFLYHLNSSAQLLRAEKLRFNLGAKDSSIIKVSVLITKILIL